MTGRHWARLEELAARPLGGELDAATRREVEWRGWLQRAPAGLMLSPLGRHALAGERARRAHASELAASRRTSSDASRRPRGEPSRRSPGRITDG